MIERTKFTNYQEFYHFYLSEHSVPTCRSLHYAGSSLVIIVLSFSLVNQQYNLLWSLPFIGYGFAWVGHFFFEHNKPATFKWPFWSLVSDWVMFFQFLTGRLPKEYFKVVEKVVK